MLGPTSTIETRTSRPCRNIYVCGHQTLTAQRKPLSPPVREMFEPSEGRALLCKAMATPRRKDCRSEERRKWSVSRKNKTIFYIDFT
jgi:hypothetical protein